MVVTIPKNKYAGAVREVTIGATKAQGGTRATTVTVGGETPARWASSMIDALTTKSTFSSANFASLASRPESRPSSSERA